MKIKILINLIILLSWACHGPSDEKSSYPPGSYIPEIDNSLAGSIIVDEYLIKNGYALHDGREVIYVTSATSDSMLHYLPATRGDQFPPSYLDSIL